MVSSHHALDFTLTFAIMIIIYYFLKNIFGNFNNQVLLIKPHFTNVVAMGPTTHPWPRQQLLLIMLSGPGVHVLLTYSQIRHSLPTR